VKGFPYKGQLYSPGEALAHWIYNMVLPMFLVLGFSLVVVFVTLRVSDEKSTGIKVRCADVQIKYYWVNHWYIE